MEVRLCLDNPTGGVGLPKTTDKKGGFRNELDQGIL